MLAATAVAVSFDSKWHKIACTAKLATARTPSDTLLLVRSDSYCVKVLPDAIREGL